MDTISLAEKNLIDAFASLSPEQAAEIDKRTEELAKNANFCKTAEILKLSRSVENINDVKFVSELGCLSVLSVAIVLIAVL